MDANTLSMSTCLDEIVSQRIPWAGDPGADFNSGLYAVLDHAENDASAVMYYRPQSHQFLLYVFVPSHDERSAAYVADAVTRYLRHSSALDECPGAVLHELDRAEADCRITALRRQLGEPAGTEAAFRVF